MFISTTQTSPARPFHVSIHRSISVGAGAPISGIGSDTFSVRWTGKIKPQTTEKYTFYLTSNDRGERLWVNHQLVIDHWTSHTSGEDKGTISLTANKSYDIQVEAWDNTGTARQLKWSSTKVAERSAWRRPSPGSQNLNSMLDDDLVFASSQLKQTMSAWGTTPANLNRTGSNGKWNVVPASDWTSGFLGGQFWEMFNATNKNAFWSTEATAWTTPLASQTSQNGDLAFRLMTTFLPLYELTGNVKYKQVCLTQRRRNRRRGTKPSARSPPRGTNPRPAIPMQTLAC